ncbi:MAG TPA: bifunctional nuclease family protein [Myxococcota bacterium]|nr:bifunctional nuclease family protein [Myxococcota bacterium]
MIVPRHRTHLLVALLLVVGSGLAACDGGRGDPGGQEVEVDVADVVRDAGGNPVILLDEHDGSRTLPIWIGISEARSIAARLERIEPLRPNTHDLAKSLLEGLGGSVERVVVTELRDRTYYGVIQLDGPTGHIEIDSRPSDAIALALRLDAPIFVREALFEEAGVDDEAESSPGREVRHRLEDEGESI